MNKPKKQPIRFTLLLTSAIIFLVAVPSARSSEPSCNGKPLSEWLLVLEERHTLSGEPVEASDAQEAVRQIGTNGIPTLIDLLSVYDERSEKKVLSKLHNNELTAWFKYEENISSSCKNLRKLGLNGFSILGTNAECAVPQITKILYSDEAPRALLAVGPKGFSALTNALNDPNAGIRDIVIRALGKGDGGDPEVVKQLLANALKDPDMHIRLHAADFLRDKAPDLVIATLMPLLDPSDYGNCYSAADTLATLGPAAKIAAPKLLSVFTNVVCGTNEYLIKNLTGDLLGALKAIDPDTAREAEDFILNGGPLGTVGYGWTDTLLPNGKKLIAGGFFQTTIPTKANHVFSRAQLFDPTTGKRTETGSMNVARYGHTATLLHNGKVLVAGGENLRDDGRLNRLSSAELYDPTTGKWIVTDSMNTASAGAEAILQSDGKVRIPGYYEGDQKKPGDNLYDPATGTWTVITNK
jgi:hypothetical protein